MAGSLTYFGLYWNTQSFYWRGVPWLCSCFFPPNCLSCWNFLPSTFWYAFMFACFACLCYCLFPCLPFPPAPAECKLPVGNNVICRIPSTQNALCLAQSRGAQWIFLEWINQDNGLMWLYPSFISFNSLVFSFFFLAMPMACRIPGPGFRSVPQQWQWWILNLLSHQRTRYISLSLFFFFFQGHTCSIWKFPG